MDRRASTRIADVLDFSDDSDAEEYEAEVRDSMSHLPNMGARASRRSGVVLADTDSRKELRKSLKLKQRSKMALEHAREVASGSQALYGAAAPPPGMGRFSGAGDPAERGSQRGSSRSTSSAGIKPKLNKLSRQQSGSIYEAESSEAIALLREGGVAALAEKRHSQMIQS